MNKIEPVENNLGSRLKKFRLSLGLTQDKFAENLSITGGYISVVEKGKATPSGAVLSEIVSCHRVNRKWLETGEGEMLRPHPTRIMASVEQRYNVAPGPKILGCVPLISWVQAGDWTEVIDNYQPGNAEDWITTTSPVGKNAFALRVVGNSMEPEFREGEIVTVDPDREAESGSYVIAKINHDEATFKQLIKDGGSVFLRPINDAYPLMDVTGRDLRIVGRVVEKVKRY